MPTRAAIEAATPHCSTLRRQPAFVDEHPNYGVRGGTLTTLREVEMVCDRLMRYHRTSNTWACECGSAECAYDVVIERLTV